MKPYKRELKQGLRNPINNPIRFFQVLIGTTIDAHDNYHVSIPERQKHPEGNKFTCCPVVLPP